MIALHGFSRSAETFAPMGQTIPPDTVLYAPDLPFHGPEPWEVDSFAPKHMVEVVHHILDREKTDRFYLVGFSLGARLCWKMLPLLRILPERLLAIAPDGLNTRFLSKLAGSPRWLNTMVHRMAQNPERFAERLGRWRRRGLPVGYLENFVLYGTQNPRLRGLFYGVGKSLPDLRVRRRQLKRFLEKSGLPVRIVLGKYDPVIPLSAADGLRDLPNVSVEVLEANHRIVVHGRGRLLWEQLFDRSAERTQT